MQPAGVHVSPFEKHPPEKIRTLITKKERVLTTKRGLSEVWEGHIRIWIGLERSLHCDP